VELDDLLARRDELNKRIQQILDEATEPWGIKVTTRPDNPRHYLVDHPGLRHQGREGV
jgi:hypothetical protein